MLRYVTELPLNWHHIPRYNVAPTQEVIAVINDGEKNKLGPLRWGLIPSWARDGKIGSSMINARSETLLEKASFKTLIARKRCIVPADGFYEWKKNGTSKQPYRIVMNDGGIFSMAALYDTWVNPEGKKINTCTIITTTPNRLMEEIHDRMPVILPREDEQNWLDRSNQDAGALVQLLRPYPAKEMRSYPVAQMVGNPKNDHSACIEEAT